MNNPNNPNNNNRSNIFGTPGRYDQSMNVPVSGSISPYTSFNPALLPNPESQFILPEGATHKRQRFDLSFGLIGTSVLTGGIVGGLHGLNKYRILNRESAVEKKSVQLTRIVSVAGKEMARGAQMCGSAVMLYSMIVVGLSQVRNDDELNTVAAGILAGALFGSSGGRIKAAQGALAGCLMAGFYCAFMEPEKMKEIKKSVFS